MREHRALRAAGGAGGVEQREGVLLGDRRRPARSQDAVSVCERRARPVADDEAFAQMRQRRARGQMLGEIALIDQPGGLALREDEFGLRRALPDAHRHDDDAGARAGQHRVDELEAIPEQQREAVALAEAALRQIAGDSLDRLVERAIGDALIAEHQRVALRMRARPPRGTSRRYAPGAPRSSGRRGCRSAFRGGARTMDLSAPRGSGARAGSRRRRSATAR